MTTEGLKKAEEAFQKTIAHLKSEFSKLQVGRANPSLVEELMVEAYNGKQPLKGLASVSVPDPRTLRIQPWDRSLLQAIEKAILTANLGLTPTNDGIVVRITLPALTEERRKELVKVAGKMMEEARIAIRTGRGDAHASFRTLEKDKAITEDEARMAEKKLQEKVDKANNDIEEMARKKEQEILTV